MTLANWLRPVAARHAVLLVCALLCAGCVTLRSAGLPPLPDYAARQQALNNVRNWGFTGRIAVRDSLDGFNGNLHWEQRREYFDARVSGPLGMGTVRIAGDPGEVRVTDKDGGEVLLDDPENDLRRLYGWHIPVESLRYWALGIPDPAHVATTEQAPDGRLTRLQQAGWTVVIDRYRPGGGQLMPRRLKASRGDSRVTLVIDRWAFR